MDTNTVTDRLTREALVEYLHRRIAYLQWWERADGETAIAAATAAGKRVVYDNEDGTIYDAATNQPFVTEQGEWDYENWLHTDSLNRWYEQNVASDPHPGHTDENPWHGVFNEDNESVEALNVVLSLVGEG